ncbi:aminodeoxychorismate lyase [Brumicola pallidula]|jgi:4-amino-4-deoxychorismate lyase|uniref:Aminodeoxychorismate lyase n=1 Tax=Brumicola pallidula DSM 14239 = ACAM 615 TaxID=1121922 RepID=K6ZJD0_9ALTE|nr:aminodeoxychorismate lyase [Glaciecola pallidula]GAC28993.1 4-amino-4-deoxychorismate lyase [Glaciecola pallidula DSM 14239 = ACAM 615]
MTNLSGFIITKSPTLKNRALNYGDGCFSTMLSNKGQVELLHRHVMRLLTDAKKLHILNDEVIFTINDLKVLINDFALNSYKLSNKNDQAEYQVVKLLIARGDSERGYTPSLHSSVVLVPSSQNYHRIANRTVGLGLARMTLAEQPILSGIKHLNRLEQVMAKIELTDHKGVDDLVLTNAKGIMIELTSSNLFYCIDGQWHTPCLDKSGVNGVMRQFVLDYMQRNKISCTVCEMNVSALAFAQSVFSCNAVTQIVPVSFLNMNGNCIKFETQSSQLLAQKISVEIVQEQV